MKMKLIDMIIQLTNILIASRIAYTELGQYRMVAHEPIDKSQLTSEVMCYSALKKSQAPSRNFSTSLFPSKGFP